MFVWKLKSPKEKYWFPAAWGESKLKALFTLQFLWNTQDQRWLNLKPSLTCLTRSSFFIPSIDSPLCKFRCSRTRCNSFSQDTAVQSRGTNWKKNCNNRTLCFDYKSLENLVLHLEARCIVSLRGVCLHCQYSCDKSHSCEFISREYTRLDFQTRENLADAQRPLQERHLSRVQE